MDRDIVPKMMFPLDKYSYSNKCSTGVCLPLSWLAERFGAISTWSHRTTCPGTTPGRPLGDKDFDLRAFKCPRLLERSFPHGMGGAES